MHWFSQYATLMVGLLLFETVGFVLVFQYYVEIDIVAENKMQRLVRDFEHGNNVTADLLNEIQTRLKCCGATSYTDYGSSYPNSCCVAQSVVVETSENGNLSSNLTHCVKPDFITACVDAVSKLVSGTTLIVVAILLSHIGAQCVSLVVSCMTVRRRAKKDARLLASYMDLERAQNRRSPVSDGE